MKHVGIVEAAAQFPSLLDEVERGEEITIMRDGKPIARLVPTAAELTLAPEYPPEEIERRRAAVARIRASARGLFDDVSHDEIKAWIDEGRG